MKDKIRAKMEAHVKFILEQPIITDAEYNILAQHLDKIEAEDARAAFAEQTKKMEAVLSLMGGAF